MTLKKLLKLSLQLIVKKHTFRGIVHCLSADALENAESIWIRHAQEDLTNDATYRFRRLGPQLIDDSVTVGQRINKWIENN